MRNWVSSPAYLLTVERLAEARRTHGLSQREVEEKLGKSYHGWLAKIERGERQANVIDMVAILRAVGEDERAFFEALLSALPKDLSV